jgi:hypothetical protein
VFATGPRKRGFNQFSLSFGFHKAKIKVFAGTCSFPEALKKNLLAHSFHFVAEFNSFPLWLSTWGVLKVTCIPCLGSLSPSSNPVIVTKVNSFSCLEISLSASFLFCLLLQYFAVDSFAL